MISNIVMLGALGAPEIIVILLIVILLFGGKKIPELFKGLGQGVREFKKASSGESEKKETAEENPELNKLK